MNVWVRVGLFGVMLGFGPALGAADEVLAEAEQAVQAGDLGQAVELYEALAAAEGAETAGRARLGLAACQVRLGQLAAAETTLLSLTVSDLPADPTLGGQIPAERGRKVLGQAYRWLAEVHQRRQDYGNALTLLLRSLLTFPGPSAMREAGEQACLYSYPEALQSEYEALLGEDTPMEKWTRAHEVYFLAYAGALAEAREVLEGRLREDPDSPMAGAFWAKLGEIAKREGDLSRAVECYEQALAWAEGVGDEFAVARLHLGYLYEQLGRAEEAQKQFEHILERSPLFISPAGCSRRKRGGARRRAAVDGGDAGTAGPGPGGGVSVPGLCRFLSAERNGPLEVSFDQGTTWDTVGRVLLPAQQALPYQGFTASRWGQPATVVGTGVNAPHLKLLFPGLRRPAGHRRVQAAEN